MGRFRTNPPAVVLPKRVQLAFGSYLSGVPKNMQWFSRLTAQLCLIVSIAAIGMLAGCEQGNGIDTYTVEEIIPVETTTPAVSGAFAASNPPAWFFKMTGHPDEVLKQIVPFSQIIKSLIFDAGGAPHYDYPKEWTKTAGPSPRYETLTIPETNPKLELTVSTLAGPGSEFEQYLLANINRWRGQVGLEDYTDENWLVDARSKGELVVIPGDSRVTTLVNLTGTIEGQGPSRILGAIVLLAPGLKADNMTEAPAMKQPIETKSPMTFDVPETWSKSPGNSMRLASFDAKQESGTADVSVMRLPGGGDPLPNLNRWRDQVKLEPITQEELDSTAKDVQIGGRSGQYVEAIGPEQSILAAILPDGNGKWFFKIQGPKDVVAAEAAHFEAFIASVKFENSEQDQAESP